MATRGRGQKEIAFLSLFEAFEEGNIEEFRNITNKFSFKDEEILLKRDVDKRTALHLVCKKGKIDFFNFLLPMYRRIPGSLDLLDEKQDTALNLACSHGFDQPPDFDEKVKKGEKNDNAVEQFLAIKGAMVTQLLRPDSGEKADIRKSFTPNKNSPLHWAIYYGELTGGMVIYEEYPLSILFKNNDNQTPLELLFQKSLKKRFKTRSKLLAKQIIEKFVQALFHQDFDFIFRNSTESEKAQFREIHSLQPETKSFELDRLIQRLMKKGQNKLITEILERDRNFINLLSKSKGFAKLIDKFKSENQQTDRGEEENLIANFVLNGLSDRMLTSENPEIIDQFQVLEDPVDDYNDNDDKDQLDDPNDDENFKEVFDGEQNTMAINEETHFNSVNESIDLNDENVEEFVPGSEEIEIYDDQDSSVYRSKSLRFLHKLLTISAELNNVHIVKILILSFNLSPFVFTINGNSTIYACSLRDNHKMLRYLLGLTYKFLNSSRAFIITDQINRPETSMKNTPIHAAFKANRKNCVLALMEKGADLTYPNASNWLPFELTRKQELYTSALKILNDFSRENLASFELTNPQFKPDPSKLYHFKSNYQYLIIARDSESLYTDTLIYKQLLEIQKRYTPEDFMITCIMPMSSADATFKEVVKYYRFYFVINLSDEVMDSIGDLLNLQLLNQRKEYVEPFIKANARQFERFRDFHVHQIIMHLLNSEFNVDLFKKKGIIEDHFPIHDFTALKQLSRRLRFEKVKDVILNIQSSKQEDLRPFHSIAFYYGCDYGFYMAFNSRYVINIFIIAILGLALMIAIIVKWESFDYFLTPIYSLLVTIWVTVVYEQWKRREKELAFSWNSTKFKQNEVPRIEYVGHYSIHPISKEICETQFGNPYYPILVF